MLLFGIQVVDHFLIQRVRDTLHAVADQIVKFHKDRVRLNCIDESLLKKDQTEFVHNVVGQGPVLPLLEPRLLLPWRLLGVEGDVGTEGTKLVGVEETIGCLLYTSPSPRDLSTSRMPSSA